MISVSQKGLSRAHKAHNIVLISNPNESHVRPNYRFTSTILTKTHMSPNFELNPCSGSPKTRNTADSKRWILGLGTI